MKKRLSLILTALLLSSIIPTAFAWEIDRPSTSLSFFKERAENATTNDEASVGLGVQVATYLENDADYDDGMNLRISATANTRKGIDYCVFNAQYSWVDIGEPDGELELYDDIEEIHLPLYETICFYGGPRSGEYSKIRNTKRKSIDVGLCVLNNRRKSPVKASDPIDLAATDMDLALRI